MTALSAVAEVSCDWLAAQKDAEDCSPADMAGPPAAGRKKVQDNTQDQSNPYADDQAACAD